MQEFQTANQTSAQRLARALPSETADEKAGDAIIGTLQAAGNAAFRVGGSVRDRLLGKVPREVDVATDATPQRVREIFPRTFAVGESFGVVVVHTESGVDIEVATFREEREYADGRHPSHVRFSTAERDAQRRDFTINALFYDPLTQQILDYVGGIADLEKGTLRAIGTPVDRFREDHLRLLRAVRFSASLGFELAPATRAAVRPLAGSLRRISPERIAAELSRMLTGPDPARAFALLMEHGLLQECLPEVVAMKGTEQPPQFHPEGDVWQHTLLMLSLLRYPVPELAWAVLLHDVGKPPTCEFRDGRYRFSKHCAVGAELARKILRRLRMSNRFTECVSECVRRHMGFMHVDDMRQSTLRRFIGADTFPLELELHRLDCAASHGMFDNYVFLLDRLADYAAEPPVPEPLVRGGDILALGLEPGPMVGKLLAMVQEWQLEGEIATKADALERLRHHLEQQESENSGRSQ